MRHHGTSGSSAAVRVDADTSPSLTGLSATGSSFSTRYRREAKRLLDIAESTSVEAKMALVEMACLYETLADHVEQRAQRARVRR
jgi:hypothetical protein